jgi:hypothetical protein
MHSVKTTALAFLFALLSTISFAQTPQPVTHTGATDQTSFVLENFLSYADGHNATDYGYAMTNFCTKIGCSTLTSPVSVVTVNPGICKVYTQMQIPPAVGFDGGSCQFIPQSTMAQTPVTLTSGSTSIGSNVVTVASTAGLQVGMAVGGPTLGPENYVTGVTDSTHFTVALNAQRIALGVLVLSSPTISGLNSFSDFAVGQTVTGTGIPAATTISSISQSAHTITLSANATVGTQSPVSIALASGTVLTGETFTAVVQNPVILRVGSSTMYRRSHGPDLSNVALKNVTINDPAFSASSPGRSLAGVQGIQIYGADNQALDNIHINGLDGSCLVLGGYVPSTQAAGFNTVRESDISKIYCYDTGDVTTGQAAAAFMTGFGAGGSTQDEINQISLQHAHLVYSDGEALTIGSYLHTGTNGPRLLWIGGDDSQFEAGINSTLNYFGNSDVVRILIGGNNIHFTGGEYVAPGFGHSVFRVDSGSELSVTNSSFGTSSASATYTVSFANGSPTVTTTGLPTGPYLNGIAVQLFDSASCAAGCTYWASTTSAVNGAGTTLTLDSNYTGSQTTGTMVIETGGYYLNLSGASSLPYFTSIGNAYSDPSTVVTTQLGLSLSSYSFQVGDGAAQTAIIQTNDYLNGFQAYGMNILPRALNAYGQSGVLNFIAPSLQGSSTIQRTNTTEYLLAGSGNDPSMFFYTSSNGTGDFYWNMQNLASGGSQGAYFGLVPTNSNCAWYGTQGYTQVWRAGQFCSTNWVLQDTTNSSKAAITVVPGTEAITTVGTITSPGYYNPVAGAAGMDFYVKNDLVGETPLGNGPIGSPSGNTGNTCTTFMDNNHPGNTCAVSGTAINTGEYLVVASGAPYIFSNAASNTNPWSFETAVYPSVLPATTASTYNVGFVHSYAANPNVTGFGFVLSSGNSVANDWYCYYGATPTTVDSTVAATVAWHRLALVSDGTKLHWYVDGTQVCGTGVALSGLYTNTIQPQWFAVTNTASTSVTLAVDYWTISEGVTR